VVQRKLKTLNAVQKGRRHLLINVVYNED